jgi:hypothetical protein
VSSDSTVDQLDRLTTNFAATMAEQQRQAVAGMRTVSAELDRATDRLAAMISDTPAPNPAPAAAGQAGPGGPAAAPSPVPASVHLLDVPLPVVVTNWPSTSTVGAAAAVGTGVGSFLGSIVAGAVSPGMAFADVIGLIVVADKVRGLVVELRAFGNELIKALDTLITHLFDELTAAGFLPISRLVAALLFLIDRAVTVVVAHLQPYLDWIGAAMTAFSTWFGATLAAVRVWMNAWIDASVAHLSNYVDYMFAAIVAPFLHKAMLDVAGTLIGALFAGVNAFVAAVTAWGRYFLASARLMVAEFLNQHGLRVVAPTPVEPDYGRIWEAAAAQGRAGGRDLALTLVGPAEPVTAVKPKLARPKLNLPPSLTLPPMPGDAPRLEQVLTTPPATGPLPAPAPAPAPAVTGGVTVQIRAETVSMENAEATARVIAEHLVDELARLTQGDRFARGLATGPVS